MTIHPELEPFHHGGLGGGKVERQILQADPSGTPHFKNVACLVRAQVNGLRQCWILKTNAAS
jgi:hypothetical protein